MQQQFLILMCFCICTNWAIGQRNLPELKLTKAEVEKHLRYLASDELQGRRTGERGNQLAAAYIAAQLASYGVQKVAGQRDYFQAVPLRKVNPPQQATLTWKKKTFEQGKNLLIFSSEAGKIQTRTVFAGHGWVDAAEGIDDYKDLDVKGKLVVVNMGAPDGQRSPTAVIKAGAKKRQLAKERGAIGVIELFQLGKSYWNMAANYYMRPRIELTAENEISDTPFLYGWILEDEMSWSKAIKKSNKQKVALELSASTSERLQSDNVVGVITGSDAQLKEEYVLLTAHYDHVGTGKNGGGAFTAKDSIFNGARDNGIGTVALLSAAKALSQKPPKRSVIILAVTAEELGLLGSRYYANHPLLPLEKTIYGLNTDGAGYNTKDRVTVVGLGRTGADTEIEKGAALVGLKVGKDPAPQQGLFDRSDNVNFAAKGIPAPTFSPGFTDFDAELMQYYHQVADNPESVDFDYLLKFCQAYSHTARLIADRLERPFWTAGDKYEAAGKALYGRE